MIGVTAVQAAPLGLTGSGQIIAVADSGLDTGVNNVKADRWSPLVSKRDS